MKTKNERKKKKRTSKRIPGDLSQQKYCQRFRAWPWHFLSSKKMATHSSTHAWKISRRGMTAHGVTKRRTWLSDFTFTKNTMTLSSDSENVSCITLNEEETFCCSPCDTNCGTASFLLLRKKPVWTFRLDPSQ